MDVRIQDVTKVWNAGTPRQLVALAQTSHVFRSGRLSCLLGPSGCGKSTLIRLIGGLEAMTSGSIEIIDPKSGRKQPIGANSVMMWQGLNLFPWRTVIDNVAFGLEVTGVQREERRDRARTMLATVGLHRFTDHYPSQLSGGMRQRVALARALILGRDILLMDEPFAALDAQTKIVMQMELLKIFEALRRTILFVTHSIDEAILLGDEIVVMSSRPGRIKDVINVPFPRPRSLDIVKSQEFGLLFDRAFQLIREEVLQSMDERLQDTA
jgi:NitT/TauT family transport system ATP-binding protein